VTRENPREPPLETRDVVAWGVQECGYHRDGRDDKVFYGQRSRLAGVLDAGGNPSDDDAWTTHTEICGEIRFFGTSETLDEVKGPLHTNDDLLLCGSPKFGRRPSDTIETSGAVDGKGYRQDYGCSGDPIVNDPGETAPDRGTMRPNAPLVTLPKSNASLRDDALPAYRFVGRTDIVLEGDTMRVTGTRENGAVLDNTPMPVPTDGVIYVANSLTGVCSGYDPVNPYGSQAACGDAWVQGTYNQSLTINADNDIVIRDSVIAGATGKPLLGLISNNWIRVYHPSTNSCNDGPGPVTIHAAILSVNHSFTVDNYFCGGKLGDLTVYGAIGQKYRGPVGTGGASSGTGYVKKYTYNDDLRFRSPPRFLDPVQSAWKLRSQVEQLPAS